MFVSRAMDSGFGPMCVSESSAQREDAPASAAGRWRVAKSAAPASAAEEGAAGSEVEGH